MLLRGIELEKINRLGLTKPETITATGYVGITTAMVGLGNCTNTADSPKPVSADTLSALTAMDSAFGTSLSGEVLQL